MTYSSAAREDQIAFALGQCAASIKQAESKRWEFSLANGRPHGVSARLVEDWLLLDAQVASGGGWCDLLTLNATLDGLSKFVVTPGTRSIHLRAEVPLPADEDNESDCVSENEDVSPRVLDACAGLKAAFGCLWGEKGGDLRAASLEGGSRTPDQLELEVLRGMCSDAGWPSIERSAGKLMVDLDVRTGFYQATVARRDAGVEIAVEILRSEVVSESSRNAVSLLLLETGALVRLARPSILRHDNRISARFEVRFTMRPTAHDLARALSSLSVACSISGREAQALQDEAIAGNYLAILGAQASVPASFAGD